MTQLPKKRMKRILTAMLILALIMGFFRQMSTPAYAAGSAPAMVLGPQVLNRDVNTPNTQVLHFGGCDWYVIAYDGKDGNGPIIYQYPSGYQENLYPEGTVTLLAKGDLGYGAYDKKGFSGGNLYEGSLIQNKLEGEGGILSKFLSGEQEAVLERTLQGGAVNYDDPTTYGANQITGDSVKARLWPLSVSEAASVSGDARASWFFFDWWLRSPGVNSENAAFASGGTADINVVGDKVWNEFFDYRPAFFLNPDAVLFTSSATGGKASGEEGADALLLQTDKTNSNKEWKATVKDSAHAGFAVDTTKTIYNEETGEVNVAYTGAVAEANSYLSAIITDKPITDNNAQILYYGRVAKVSSAEGTATINTAGKMMSEDTLYVFNEQYNEDKLTDFASDPVTFPFLIASTPEISASDITIAEDETISVSIPSDATGTVKMTVTDPTGKDTVYNITITDTMGGKGEITLSGLAPGTYSVKAEYSGDKRYQISSGKTTFNVSLMTPAYTVPKDLAATYGQTLAEVPLPSADNGTWKWMDDSSGVGKAGTNTHKAKFTPTDSEHYRIVENIDVPVAVAKKTVTVSGIKAKDKEIDGTKDAELVYSDVVIKGVLNADKGKLSVRGTGTFEDAKYGINKTVHITDLALGGDAAANYQLASEGQQTVTTASIKDDKHHAWGPWKVTKKPTATSEGERQRVCQNDASHIEKETIPPIGKKPKEPEKPDTPKKDKPVTPEKEEVTPQGVLLTKLAAKGKNGLKLTWKKVKGAEGYDIFFSRCNHGNKKLTCRKIKTVKGNKTFSWTKKGLKKNRSYKAYIRAWVKKGGKKTYIRTSPMVHAFTSGGTKKYTNPKSVTVTKKNITLTAGKTHRIKARVTKLQKNKKLISVSHTNKLRYMSSNKTIATVSKSGRVTAHAKGSCRIYVYAANGVRKTIRVTVK